MRKASLVMRALIVATLLLVISLLSGCAERFASTESLSRLLSEGNFSFALIVASVAGFLTALSPCVYPIIPITLSVIGARRYESAFHGFLVSLCYVAGMVTLYVGLGILFSSLGMLFGTVFRHPAVLIAVALLFVFFALSMFGVLNWLLPQSVMTRLSNFGGSGFKGAFFMGLVSGVIASPCTGPVLAFILTLISQSGDMGKGSLLMVSFGVGMGFPFLLLGTFSSALSRLPKSGAWMNRIKFVFGVVMLLASLYFFQLGVSGLFKGQERVTDVSKPGEALSWLKIGKEPDALEKLQTALDDAQSKSLPVMIDFYADWCVACGELEKLTFRDPQVSTELSHFKLIRVDLTSETDALKQIEKKYAIVGLPLLVFYNSKGAMLEDLKIFGFMKSQEFLSFLARAQASH